MPGCRRGQSCVSGQSNAAPRTEPIDRGRKLRIYGRERVSHLWLANPATQTLERYRLVNGAWVVDDVHHGDAVIRVEPFAEIEIELRHLWARTARQPDED